VGFGVAGCVRQPPAALLDQLRIAREHAGLRPVQEKWRISKFDAGEIAWADPDQKSDKKVAYENEAPVWEEDYFYSGRKFLATDGDGDNVSEQLTVSYDYKTGLCAVRVITDDPHLQAMVKGKVADYGVKLDDALPIAREILQKVLAKKRFGPPLVPKLHLGTHLSAKLRFPHTPSMRSRDRIHESQAPASSPARLSPGSPFSPRRRVSHGATESAEEDSLLLLLLLLLRLRDFRDSV
jgi:hypothetical protein